MSEYPSAVPPLPQKKNSALALWSMILGILALVSLFGCVGILFAIPGVICAHMAYSRIKRSNGELEGQGMALAGMIMNYICIGLSVVMLPLLMAIAIPNFVKARQTSQQNACINNLRRIDAAKNQWALEKGKKDGDTPTAADLDPYIRGGFNSLHCPAQGTYSINPVGQAPTCTVKGHQLPAYSGP